MKYLYFTLSEFKYRHILQDYFIVRKVYSSIGREIKELGNNDEREFQFLSILKERERELERERNQKSFHVINRIERDAGRCTTP